MSVAQILSRAESLGVHLRLEGDIVKMHGPKEARDLIRADIVTHKPQIVAHLRAAANDAESIPDDCVDSPISDDGAPFWPWAPYMQPDDARRMRSELVGMIEDLANLECWPRSLLDDVLTAAVRGPLSALLPDLAYFRERLAEAHAEAEAREAVHRRAWHLEGFDDRRPF